MDQPKHLTRGSRSEDSASAFRKAEALARRILAVPKSQLRVTTRAKRSGGKR
jgi:hypothetical protein